MSLPAGMPVLASKVSSIIDNLGLSQEEVGDIIDASPRTISRWITGTVAPQRLNKQRLIELAYVAEAVTEVLPRDQANVWMLSPNRLLDHESPADRVHAGRYKDVLDLIEGLAEGIVV
ncbi:helix-turn-helix domain-containing protein [Microbacterium sp. SSW1-47]|uniref:helix-turn-helix domain-containing protein n=1 Tax=Microbacterium sufflavum TaxID=2851649 RepID=UPI001FFDDCCB|nr:helix-turn-helix domain-containing protein [Microbacterium sufflavum]MCK2028076.1 helix-turn-helix domain-containing protein [Microbacterium sufflavum]